MLTEIFLGCQLGCMDNRETEKDDVCLHNGGSYSDVVLERRRDADAELSMRQCRVSVIFNDRRQLQDASMSCSYIA